MKFPPKQPLAGNLRQMWHLNKYLWMSLGFVLLYIPLAIAQNLIIVPTWTVWLLFGLSVIDGICRTAIALHLGGNLPAPLAWVFTVIELGLIAAAIAVTGGIQSELWLLYFVVTIFESMYATPHEKRILNLIVVTSYLLATLIVQTHPQHTLPAPQFWRILGTHVFFIIIVGSLGRRISANMMERNKEIARLREEVAVGEERARIAREVHDGLGHALVGSILQLELARKLVKRDPDEAETILQTEIPAIRAAWNEGRDLAFHLRPWETDGGSLTQTLERHLRRFADRTGIVTDFASDGETENLPPDIAFVLTRVVQEALTNAAKHAQATHIHLHLTRTPTQITLTLRDNGIGFDAQRAGSGIGLASMRERLAALGGTLEITGEMGRGTTLTAVISLPQRR
jgi:signal transduction histidine kinase